MDYALIGKIEKAKIYAEEKDRIHFDSFAVRIAGDHDEHGVAFKDGAWGCDCDFFHTRGYCSHTMAMERVLGDMINDKAAEAV